MAKKVSKQATKVTPTFAVTSIPFASVWILIAVAVVFLPAVGFDFLIWDDNRHLLENPGVLAPTWEKAAGFWKAPYFNLYIPLTYNAWQLLALVGRTSIEPLHPSLFHGINVLFHALNALCVFWLLKQVFRARDNGASNLPAFLGTLLFALHPLQVAPVAWVSGFRDLLGAFLLLTSIILSLKAQQIPEKRPWLLAGSLLSFTLSVSAKPSGVVLPLLLVVLFQWLFPKKWKESLKATALYWALAAPFAYLTKATQPNTMLEFVTPVLHRPWVALDALGFYVLKWVWPWALGPDYGRSPKVVLASIETLFTTLVFITVLAFALSVRKKFPEALFGLSWFVCALLPVLGFVPFIFQAYSTVSDNYVYLAMMGASWALGAMIVRFFSLKWPLWAATFVLVSFGVRSGFQLQHWTDNAAFLENALRVNPNSSALIANFAVTLQRQGKNEEALALYRKSLLITPNDPTPFNALANLLLEMGRYDEVISQLEPYLARTQPNDMLKEILSRMHTNLGAAYYRKGNKERAVFEMNESLRLYPQNSRSHSNLGAIYFEQGRFTEAAASFERALQQEPNNEEFLKNLELSRARASGD